MFSFFKNLFTGNTPKKSCCGKGCCSVSLVEHDKMLQLTSDDVAQLKTLPKSLIIGKVEKVEDHPSEKMTKVKVARVVLDKAGKTETICCGGTNLKAGQIVAVAQVGTVLPGDFKIGVRDLRGVESRGMICARKELEISAENEGPKEIWVLSDHYEKHVGASLSELV